MISTTKIIVQYLSLIFFTQIQRMFFYFSYHVMEESVALHFASYFTNVVDLFVCAVCVLDIYMGFVVDVVLYGN